MNFYRRIVCALIASLMATHALSQDISGWSDKTVCRLASSQQDDPQYLQEAKNRGLSCGSEVAKKQSSNSNSNSNSKARNVKAKDINFPGKFQTTEIKSCKAMDDNYTPTLSKKSTIRKVKKLVGYDWPADWEMNSNSMNVHHQGITVPMTMLMSATHNAIANDNQANIIIAKNLLLDLAKADTLYDSIGYYDVKKKPMCYAGGDVNAPCWYHQYAFASDVFANYIITALWLRDELNEQEIEIVNQYINKMYKKFLKPTEFQTHEQGFYQMANGGTGILAYASWTNDKKLAAKEITHRFKEIDSLFYEDGYINNNSFRGYRGQWYHSYGLNSALGYVYIAKLWGAEVPTRLQKKLVKAAEVTNLAITDWDKFKSRKYPGTSHNAIEDPANAKKRTHGMAFALDTLMEILTGVELARDPSYLSFRMRYMQEGIDQTVGFNPNCINVVVDKSQQDIYDEIAAFEAELAAELGE